MAAVVALIAFCPIVGVTHLGWSALVTFLSAIFEFVLWCILAFVVYQRHISSVLVFGFGYGMFMVGSGAGWLAGVHLFPQIAVTSNSIVLYLVLAFAVLACAFVLFSEKEFDRLFKPEGEASLDDLLGDELPDPHADDEAPAGKKGRFGLAIDALAEQAGLSRRARRTCCAAPAHGLRHRGHRQAPAGVVEHRAHPHAQRVRQARHPRAPGADRPRGPGHRPAAVTCARQLTTRTVAPRRRSR